MASTRDLMFYATDNKDVWGSGTQIERAKTSREAMRLAGLDWRVDMGGLWGGRTQGTATQVRGKVSVFRTDNGDVLGIPTKRYNLWQNVEALEFTDALVKDGSMRYRSAGMFDGGKQVWALASLPGTIKILDEQWTQYLFFKWGHACGEGGAIMFLPLNERPACFNIFPSLQARKNNETHVRIVHVSTMKAKLAEAQRILAVTKEANKQQQATLEKAARTKISAPTANNIQEALFGPIDDDTPPQRKRAIELFQAIYQAEAARSGKNAFAMSNAITGYADHGMRYNGPDDVRSEKRLASVVEGSAQKFKERGFAALREHS